MILKCCLLISLKIVLFLCNYLQMAISSSESIVNVQHLPRIFSPLVTLDCNHLQAEETFFCFALHPWCWPINILLLFLWWGSCLILWEAPKLCRFPLFHLLISPNSHIYLVWIVWITIREWFESISCPVTWTMLHKTQNLLVGSSIRFYLTENSYSSGCTFLNSPNTFTQLQSSIHVCLPRQLHM